MQAQNFIIGSALLILTGCQHSLVRDNMPTVTRTGEAKEVVIRDHLSPATVTANPGDEIRWINKSQGDVRVIFLTPVVMEMLTCQQNFEGILEAGHNQYSAKVKQNDSATVCFRSPLKLPYIVRTESSDPSGEQNLRGSIVIRSENQAHRLMKERNERLAAESDLKEPDFSRPGYGIGE
jgi:plastocyanin